MLLNIHHYLFYKFYQWSIKVNGKDDFHRYYASGMVAFVLMINIFTLPIIVDLVSDISIDIPDFPNVAWGGITLAFFVLNFAYFNYKERYLGILEKFKNEGRTSARRGNLAVTIYVIGSFIVLIGSGFLGAYINQLK